MKKLLFGLFSLTLLATACKKDKDAVPVNKENITGTYKLMSIKVSLNGSVPLDADDREDCEKDDLYKLNADNSFEYVDAGSVCDPAGDFTATWALNGNEITSEEFGDMNGTISSFDGTNMEVTISGTEDGVSYKLISTFQKL